MTELNLIDCDMHIFEPRSMWSDHIDPEFKDDALAIEDDELGYPWLTWKGRHLYLAELQEPAKASPIGKYRKRQEEGLPAEYLYDDVIPKEYWDPAARVAKLDEWGLDATVLFPNYGLLWEEMLTHDLTALCANMRAYNRWIGEVAAEGNGRLFGVAHLTLRDREWLEAELSTLADSGVKLAMVAPAPVDGKALSHPDLDGVWAAFCEHDIAPVFHVGGFEPPLHRAWYEGDPDPVDKLMNSIFLWVAPAVALANMIIHGTLERFPELRLGVIELTAHWVPQFVAMLEGSWGFYAARHGGPLTDLPLPPSAYFTRQVRVEALAYEQPAYLIDQVGDGTYMFGSDWPHAEGIAEPLRGYERMVEGISPSARRKLFADNIRWLLNV
jgi:predicted TIM-barrel fold metal-dependent hydrolase